MALVTYRVWYGCRVDNVAYKRGVVVQLDDTSESVQYNVGKGRLRPVEGELADSTVNTETIVDGAVAPEDIAPSETDDQVLATVAGNVAWATPTDVSVTAVPSTLVDAKGDLIAATAADTPARLAVGAIGTNPILIPDASAASGLKWGTWAEADVAKASTVGNLLTANQASVETDTTGLRGEGAAIVRSTAEAYHGAASLLVTLSGTAASNGGGTSRSTAGIPVEAGQTYTGHAAVLNGVGSRTWYVGILWWSAAGAFLDISAGTAVAAAAWTPIQVTGVAPAGAAFANVEVVASNTGADQDTVYLDCFSFHRGAGGLWQSPGVPIPNLGIRANPANATQVQVWNPGNSTWITV